MAPCLGLSAELCGWRAGRSAAAVAVAVVSESHAVRPLRGL